MHFDRVEWHVQPDAATKAAAFQAGERDWWENPPADLLPPFDKPAVRRAPMGAIDQKEFMVAMMGEDTSL